MRPIEQLNNLSQDELSPSLAERLVKYEEAMADGNGVSIETPTDDAVREDLACVDLLHRVWPDLVPPTAPDDDLHPKVLGDFRLVRELGRGGMGTVFEAEQISMGRHVALKVLPFAAVVQEKSLQRFRNEVRAAAALDHPHIVSVYSIGEERGVHFYAMQLIRGQTLADLIEELKSELQRVAVVGLADSTHPTAASPSAPNVQQALISTAVDSRRGAESYRAAARLGIQAAEALQHAHDQGVLHRDIKPSNLMLDRDGKLYVTDFGLARIEADAGMTMTGDILGTLRYMAPEQALAKRVVIDHRADIYSLGATLYELLTLQPAFGETDRSELLKQIAFAEPRPLRKIDTRIPIELETIVLKAIAKNPDERYQAAQQLADDLGAFLEDRPIKAKRFSLRDRANKWSRRHPAAIWASLLFLLGTTIISATSAALVTHSYRRETIQRELAEEATMDARKQKDDADQQRSAADASRFRMSKSLDLAHAVIGTTTTGITEYEMFLGNRDRAHLERSSTPIFVWDTNRTSGAPQCGWTYVWSSASRPEVIGSAFTFYVESEHSTRTMHELVSIATDPVQSQYRGKLLWCPQKPGIELLSVSNAPTPGGSAAERSAQLETMARQFAATAETADSPAELTPQLIYRYEHVALPVIDGAIVAFLDYGDPEAVLLLEARIESDVKKWKYAFASTAARGLTGKHLDKEVWRWNPSKHASARRNTIPGGPDIKTSPVALFREDVIPDVSRQLWAALWNQLHLIKDLLVTGEAQKAKQLLIDSQLLVQEFEHSMSIERKKHLATHLGMMLSDLMDLSAANEDFDECFAQLADIGALMDSTFNGRLLNAQAWRLATSLNEQVRDGKLAVEIATKACESTDYEKAGMVDTLAAAYAEAGDFESAIKWSEKSIAMTTDPSERTELKLHRDSFKNHKPWRN